MSVGILAKSNYKTNLPSRRFSYFIKIAISLSIDFFLMLELNVMEDVELR